MLVLVCVGVTVGVLVRVGVMVTVGVFVGVGVMVDVLVGVGVQNSGPIGPPPLALPQTPKASRIVPAAPAASAARRAMNLLRAFCARRTAVVAALLPGVKRRARRASRSAADQLLRDKATSACSTAAAAST